MGGRSESNQSESNRINHAHVAAARPVSVVDCFAGVHKVIRVRDHGHFETYK
jgi:hypothetical protein